jgi:hypothetical protein
MTYELNRYYPHALILHCVSTSSRYPSSDA